MKIFLTSALALLFVAGPAYAEGSDNSVRESIERVQRTRVVFNAADRMVLMTEDSENEARTENRRVIVTMPSATTRRGVATGTENQNDH